MKTIGSTYQEYLWVINKLHLLILTIFGLCLCHSVQGQQENNVTKYDSQTQQKVYLFVERMPFYKGGNKAFMADFAKFFHYNSAKDTQEPIQTKLRVRFIVDTEGHLIGARICDKKTTSTITAIMATCGMYDFSGEYARKVGIPSKSGVAGGILGTLPGKMGIGVYSPALDEYGNSIVGYNIMKDLSNKLNLNIY